MKSYNDGTKLTPCPHCGVTGTSTQYPTHYSNCDDNFMNTQPEEWESRLKDLLNTNEHKYGCSGYSEGQECCLEREIILSFIKSEIRKAEERVGREQYNQALFDIYKSIEALKK